MSSTLIDSARGSFPAGFIDYASETYSEPVSSITKYIDQAVPVLLSGYFQYSHVMGPGTLKGLAQEYLDSGSVPKWQSGTYKDSMPGIKTRGDEILTSVYGPKLTGIISEMASTTGVRQATSAGLLGTIAPVILGVIGGQLTHYSDNASVSAWINNNIHTGGVANSHQVVEIEREKETTNIVLNSAGSIDYESTTAAGAEMHSSYSSDPAGYKKSSTIMSRLFYLFLALMTFMVAFYFFRYGKEEPIDASNPINARTQFVPQR